MARKEQTGSGVTRGGRRGSGRRSGARASGGRKRRARASKRTSQGGARAQSQTTGQSAASSLHPAAGSVWSGAASAASPAPLLALAPRMTAPGDMLALAGAEQATLSEALRVWGDARDQAANRAWRRPGGLTRLAGL